MFSVSRASAPPRLRPNESEGMVDASHFAGDSSMRRDLHAEVTRSHHDKAPDFLKHVSKNFYEQSRGSPNPNAPCLDEQYVPQRARTEEQKAVIALAIHTLRQFESWELDGRPPQQRPRTLRLAVLGPGGTGKSWVTRAIQQVVRLKRNGEPGRCVTLAPTGCAAALVGGSTIHRECRVPSRARRGREVIRNVAAVDAVSRLKERLGKADFVAIDEVMMTSSRLLAYVEHRCGQARQAVGGCVRDDDSFGDIPIVLACGDPKQLPPVGGTPLWRSDGEVDGDSTCNLGRLAWNRFDSAIELKTVVRTDDRELLSLQNAIRHGKVKEHHVRFAQSRSFCKLEPEEKKAFEDDAIFVYPTWKQAKARYNAYLRSLNKPVLTATPKYALGGKLSSARVKAEHKEQCGLTKDVALAVGAKVMLLRNIIPELGLFNGANGTIVHIQSSAEDKIGPYTRGEEISYVIVDFQEYTGPPWRHGHRTWVPVPPFVSRCDKKCCTNRMIPLQINKICTIHKVQGATIGPGCFWPKIVINLGEDMRAAGTPGLAYVAVTRAKTSSSMAFETMPSRDLLSRLGQSSGDQKIKDYMIKFRDVEKKTMTRAEVLLEPEKWEELCDWGNSGPAEPQGRNLADLR